MALEDGEQTQQQQQQHTLKSSPMYRSLDSLTISEKFRETPASKKMLQLSSVPEHKDNEDIQDNEVIENQIGEKRGEAVNTCMIKKGRVDELRRSYSLDSLLDNLLPDHSVYNLYLNFSASKGFSKK